MLTFFSFSKKDPEAGVSRGIDFHQVPAPSDLLAPKASLTVAARTSFLEGPAVALDGQLYFSDLIGNRIYQMTPAGDRDRGCDEGAAER